jgi:hypothetical protein
MSMGIFRQGLCENWLSRMPATPRPASPPGRRICADLSMTKKTLSNRPRATAVSIPGFGW